MFRRMNLPQTMGNLLRKSKIGNGEVVTDSETATAQPVEDK